MRIGAWLSGNVRWRGQLALEADVVSTTLTALQRRIEADFALVSEEVLAIDPGDDADLVEQRTDAAMTTWVEAPR